MLHPDQEEQQEEEVIETGNQDHLALNVPSFTSLLEEEPSSPPSEEMRPIQLINSDDEDQSQDIPKHKKKEKEDEMADVETCASSEIDPNECKYTHLTSLGLADPELEEFPEDLSEDEKFNNQEEQKIKVEEEKFQLSEVGDSIGCMMPSLFDQEYPRFAKSDCLNFAYGDIGMSFENLSRVKYENLPPWEEMKDKDYHRSFFLKSPSDRMSFRSFNELNSDPFGGMKSIQSPKEFDPYGGNSKNIYELQENETQGAMMKVDEIDISEPILHTDFDSILMDK